MTNPLPTDKPAEPAAPVASDVSAPAATPGPGLGRVALIASIILAIASVLASVILGLLGAPFVDRSGPAPSFAFNTNDADPRTALLGLLSPLHALIGTGVGLWIIVQSIVAISLKRGRRQAIIALVLAILTPGISLAIYLVIMLGPR